ncbi:pancreatic lipase-related protein 2-like [Hyposmocoma kahamanoa]|uniref:pancreatic lipase-related protein 2-like n=1 Tax=Hyposmocoma kahamanoa TaxID=1477025 RepID=UPI000E6D66DA|nr:pancreatic lipase-related protein 2-like [Hyposmocoma kahamanoa]
MLRDSVANPCESMKNILGLSYEQIQARQNTTGILEALNLDEVTANGNVKYNLTPHRINRVVKGAETIVILIHGFLESSDGSMVSAVGPTLLKKPRYKILALDGSKVIGIEYLRSSTYARFSGEKLGSFLADMINDGQDPASIVLVGHSLGSHIAGVAGKQVKRLTGRQIGRITALDPAGPCFGGSVDGRIDRGDADYVEVIHTNGGALGFKEPIGDRDFYPNGGRGQPGCALATCDHSRAWLYYAEAIAEPHNFPGRRCDSWEKFKEGGCSRNAVAYMGMSFVSLTTTTNQTIIPGTYFFRTARDTPFGLGLQGIKP